MVAPSGVLCARMHMSLARTSPALRLLVQWTAQLFGSILNKCPTAAAHDCATSRTPLH